MVNFNVHRVLPLFKNGGCYNHSKGTPNSTIQRHNYNYAILKDRCGNVVKICPKNDCYYEFDL